MFLQHNIKKIKKSNRKIDNVENKLLKKLKIIDKTEKNRLEN